MNDSQRIKMLHDIADRNPHMRITNAMHKLRKAEKAEELRRPAPNQRLVLKMFRKLTGKA